MKTEKIIDTKKEIVTEIICDCCGKSCKVDEGVIDNDLRLDNNEPYYHFSYMKLEVFGDTIVIKTVKNGQHKFAKNVLTKNSVLLILKKKTTIF